MHAALVFVLLPEEYESCVYNLFRKLESNGVSATTGNEKIDKLMKDAIVVLRIHLIELQKVASLAEDFHTKYLQALRKRVSHDVLVESTGDSDDDLTEPNRHDELVSSRLQGGAVATLTTPQGTLSISFDPRTVLAGIHSASAIKSLDYGSELRSPMVNHFNEPAGKVCKGRRWIWRKSSAKKTSSISASWVTPMRKSGYQKKVSTGSGDLDQDPGMRMVTVMLGSYPPHDFFMATPFL
ncbi:unnamed protein product [Strongylus vulgaris]|uniref:MEIS N-terminal domain-containing protein n=1 Tax=Strongylus vulgaris TaxID=40348 RepID=A0A3P7IQ18_STRVU|nr:unnamed protein product [Strongylus vulgaris]